jgi:hypothetical protein
VNGPVAVTVGTPGCQKNGGVREKLAQLGEMMTWFCEVLKARIWRCRALFCL